MNTTLLTGTPKNSVTLPLENKGKDFPLGALAKKIKKIAKKTFKLKINTWFL